jgi:hypothetical protein
VRLPLIRRLWRRILTFYIHSIIFVHGLWGHPRKTWETDAPKISNSTHPPEHRAASERTFGRKTSFVGQLMRTVGSRSPQISNVSTFSSSSSSPFQLVDYKRSPDFQDTAAKQKTNKVYWPRDLLPSEIPEAKILTYGYDADVIGTVRGDHVNMKTNNFTAHGQDLLVKLQREISHQVSHNYSVIYTDSCICY